MRFKGYMTKGTNGMTEIERLEQSLMRFKSVEIDGNAKIRIKNNLMSRLPVAEFSYYGSIVLRIRELVSQVALSVTDKAKIKERVFGAMLAFPQKRMFFPRIFVYSKKFVSALLVFVFALGTLSVFTMETMVVRAEVFTHLEYFTAGTFIEREGQKINPFEGMVLYEGDRVITGENSMAAIKYFDNSVTRLSGNSGITIYKLSRPNSGKAKSYIEVSLDNGVLWSRVFNLVGKESYFVVKADDIFASAKKGAFNMEFVDEKVEIEVFSNVVDVKSVEGEKAAKVLSGKKVTVKENNVEVRNIDNDEKEVAWVKENLDSDKKEAQKNEEQLLADKKESLGIDDTKNINFDSSLKEKALILLTFNDIDKKKIELDLAEKNFLGAELKLNEQYLTKAEKAEINVVISDFANKTNAFYAAVDEVEKADPEYGKELRGYVEDKLLTLKKELGVSTQKTVYELQDVVDQLLVSGAETPEDAAEIKLEQSFDKLADVSAVAASGDEQSAKTLMEENKEIMSDVVQSLEDMDESKGEEKAELAEKTSEYFEVLNSIEGVAKDGEMTKLQEKVAEMEGGKTDENPIVTLPAEEEKEQPYGVNVSGDKPLPPGL